MQGKCDNCGTSQGPFRKDRQFGFSYCIDRGKETIRLEECIKRRRKIDAPATGNIARKEENDGN